MRDGRPLDAGDIDRIDVLSAALHGREPLDFGSMSDARLAAAFGVSPRTVLNWHAQGLPQVEAGTTHVHDLAACIRWFVARGGDRAGLKPSMPEAQRAELRLLRTRERKLRLDIEERRGRLIDVEVARRVFAQHIVEARTKLDGLVMRLVAATPPEMRSAHRPMVEGIVRDLCQDLAGGLADERMKPRAVTPDGEGP